MAELGMRAGAHCRVDYVRPLHRAVRLGHLAQGVASRRLDDELDHWAAWVPRVGVVVDLSLGSLQDGDLSRQLEVWRWTLSRTQGGRSHRCGIFVQRLLAGVVVGNIEPSIRERRGAGVPVQ